MAPQRMLQLCLTRSLLPFAGLNFIKAIKHAFTAVLVLDTAPRIAAESKQAHWSFCIKKLSQGSTSQRSQKSSGMLKNEASSWELSLQLWRTTGCHNTCLYFPDHWECGPAKPTSWNPSLHRTNSLLVKYKLLPPDAGMRFIWSA